MMDMLGHMTGIVGMGCILLAYFLMQKEKWQYNSVPYLLTNLAGSLLLIVSLLVDWNLSVFLLQIAWCCITLWGLFKLYRTHKP